MLNSESEANFYIMILLEMAECVLIAHTLKMKNAYALHTNPQHKCGQTLNFLGTMERLGYKCFKRFVFEVVDQVAGDLMTYSCRSSGDSRLLLKALIKEYRLAWTEIIIILLR